MVEKPDINKLKNVVPEAGDLYEIGSGGFKIVYKSRIGDTNEAIKLVWIPDDSGSDPIQKEARRQENLQRIGREIAVLKECPSPFIVKLGSIAPRECEIDDNTFIVYSEELLPGKSLRSLVSKQPPPTLQELATIGRCLLDAVMELSTKNVIHRDIKPDNIIMTENEDRPCVLLDLGVAFLVGGTRITKDTHHVPGTLYYLAPEMLDSGFRQNLDYRADLYAIGLTLYEFAAGKNPFARPQEVSYTTLYRIKNLKPDPLANLRPDLPTDFCRLVDQLIKKLPALRPANIAALIDSMENFK